MELYPGIRVKPDDPPMTKEIKKGMWPEVRENWRSYNRIRTGGRQMFARPFEDHFVEILRARLENLVVDVYPRKQIKVFDDLRLTIDGLLQSRKKGKPVTLISLKVTADTIGFRESFASAYFLKMRFGQQNSRFYLAATHSGISRKLFEAAKPFIDGDYYLDPALDPDPEKTEHYVDELIRELEKLYK